MSVLNILGVLLGDDDLCYQAANNMFLDMDKPYRRLSCPERQKPLIRYRTKCLAKMILDSDIADIADIRDATIK